MSYTTINVHMLAFHDYEVRPVDVPTHEYEAMKDDDLAVADSVYYYGQNDFQPNDHICSVSMGDVIELPNGNLYMVMPVGFEKISSRQLNTYRNVPREDRWKMPYRIEGE